MDTRDLPDIIFHGNIAFHNFESRLQEESWYLNFQFSIRYLYFFGHSHKTQLVCSMSGKLHLTCIMVRTYHDVMSHTCFVKATLGSWWCRYASCNPLFFLLMLTPEWNGSQWFNILSLHTGCQPAFLAKLNTTLFVSFRRYRLPHAIIWIGEHRRRSDQRVRLYQPPWCHNDDSWSYD